MAPKRKKLPTRRAQGKAKGSQQTLRMKVLKNQAFSVAREVDALKGLKAPPKAQVASPATQSAPTENRETASQTEVVPEDVPLVTKKKPTSFLDLPKKIRKQIYEHPWSFLIVTDLDVQQRWRVFAHKGPDARLGQIKICFSDEARPYTLRQPAITRVHPEIRKETLRIFYGENVFRLRYTLNANWLYEIRRHLRLFRHVQFEIKTPKDWRNKANLRMLRSLGFCKKVVQLVMPADDVGNEIDMTAGATGAQEGGADEAMDES